MVIHVRRRKNDRNRGEGHPRIVQGGGRESEHRGPEPEAEGAEIPLPDNQALDLHRKGEGIHRSLQGECGDTADSSQGDGIPQGMRGGALHHTGQRADRGLPVRSTQGRRVLPGHRMEMAQGRDRYGVHPCTGPLSARGGGQEGPPRGDIPLLGGKVPGRNLREAVQARGSLGALQRFRRKRPLVPPGQRRRGHRSRIRHHTHDEGTPGNQEGGGGPPGRPRHGEPRGHPQDILLQDGPGVRRGYPELLQPHGRQGPRDGHGGEGSRPQERARDNRLQLQERTRQSPEDVLRGNAERMDDPVALRARGEPDRSVPGTRRPVHVPVLRRRPRGRTPDLRHGDRHHRVHADQVLRDHVAAVGRRCDVLRRIPALREHDRRRAEAPRRGRGQRPDLPHHGLRQDRPRVPAGADAPRRGRGQRPDLPHHGLRQDRPRVPAGADMQDPQRVPAEVPREDRRRRQGGDGIPRMHVRRRSHQDDAGQGLLYGGRQGLLSDGMRGASEVRASLPVVVDRLHRVADRHRVRHEPRRRG